MNCVCLCVFLSKRPPGELTSALFSSIKPDHSQTTGIENADKTRSAVYAKKGRDALGCVSEIFFRKLILKTSKFFDIVKAEARGKI